MSAKKTSLVEYFLIQHMPDLFRRETRNVGVVVRRGEEIGARFWGETVPGTIDGRSIKGFPDAVAYREWVLYWRRLMRERPDPVQELLQTQREQYPVVSGGRVDGTGDDTMGMIVDELYVTLVDEAAEGRLLPQFLHTERQMSLLTTVKDEFKKRDLIDLEDGAPHLRKHRVQFQVEVLGKQIETHRPTFSQQNGKLSVFEPVDLSQPDGSRDHAGYTAFMFEDIKRANNKTECIALVRHPMIDDLLEPTKYSLSLLRAANARIVNWEDQQLRSGFLVEREKVSLA